MDPTTTDTGHIGHSSAPSAQNSDTHQAPKFTDTGSSVGKHHHHRDPSHTSTSPASKWRSCPTQGNIRQSHARRRKSGHNIIVMKAAQTEQARESNSRQDRPWEDTTPWAHSLSTPAPQPGGTRQQCNRASAQPGQANLAQKVNMKLTHAPSDGVRPIGTNGPRPEWRHSPKGRDSQSIHEVTVGRRQHGRHPTDTGPTWAQPAPGDTIASHRTRRPSLQTDTAPLRDQDKRSRTRVATTVATPITPSSTS